MKRAWMLIALAALALVLAGQGMAQTFTFTAIPDQDESALMERFGKIADYLEGELDVDVRYIPVKSYAAAVTAFRNNQVQMAWFGGLSGVQARQLVPGSQAIAQGQEDTAFVTYFIAHPSAGLSPTEDFPAGIEGKTFTFGSKGSTSGRLMPEFFIRDHFGQAPEDVFSRVGFSGDHSKTISLVASGAYQVGAVNFAVYDKEQEQGRFDTANAQIIWKTPPYPDYNWSVRGDLDDRFGQGFTDKVQQALLNMTDPDLLNAFPRSAFVAASNEDYRPILETGKAIGVID